MGHFSLGVDSPAPITMRVTTAITCLSMVVCGVLSQSTPRPAPDIESALSKRPHYSMLLDLLRSTGLLDTLKNIKNPPGMTLFAPTNLALSSIPDADFNALKNDRTRLTQLLQYHVANQAFHTNSRAYDKALTSLDRNLPIRFNSYREIHGDIVELLKNNPNTTILSKLISQAGLASAISGDMNQTLFAPTDAPLSHLDDQALTYLQNNPAAL